VALVEIVNYLRENFLARSCPVPIYLGEQFVHDHAEPSRIVIVPSSDTFGPKSPSALPVAGQNFLNPRPIATRSVSATANIWAGAPPQQDPQKQLDADFLVLDALINVFLAALNAVATGITTIGAGTNTVGQAVHARRGLVYELQFQINVPIVDTPWPSIPVECSQTYTTEQVTGAIAIQETFDGGETYETVLQFETPTPEEDP
jgi:hypothetical protein